MIQAMEYLFAGVLKDTAPKIAHYIVINQVCLCIAIMLRVCYNTYNCSIRV